MVGTEDSKVVHLFEHPPAWAVLARALAERRRVLARYHGVERLLCPHLLGFSDRRAKLLAYQCGGATSAGPLPPETSKRWRSMFVDEVEQPAIVEGAFLGAGNYRAEGPGLGMDVVELAVALGDRSPARG